MGWDQLFRARTRGARGVKQVEWDAEVKDKITRCFKWGTGSCSVSWLVRPEEDDVLVGRRVVELQATTCLSLAFRFAPPVTRR